LSLIVPPELEYDWKAARQDIVTALRGHFENTSSERGVIGLSGGVDSSVAAYLATEALGRENVVALFLPEAGVTPTEDMDDAERVAKQIGLEPVTIEISPAVRAFTALVPGVLLKGEDGSLRHPTGYANIKARVRMILLYLQANISDKAQVIGTGDKSELLLGYNTKHGDHGVDLHPIGDLYKSQVRYLAKMVGLPENVWRKKPSPQLLKGQTAEGEIGADYVTIDRVLYYRVDERYPEQRIVEELGMPEEIVHRICRMIVQSHHKRKPPPICKIGSATINWDWRMPVE